MEASFGRIGTLTRKLCQQIVIEKKLEAHDLATPGIFMAAFAGCGSKFLLRFPTAGLSSFIPRRSQKRRPSQSARLVRLTIPSVTLEEVQATIMQGLPYMGGRRQ